MYFFLNMLVHPFFFPHTLKPPPLCHRWATTSWSLLREILKCNDRPQKCYSHPAMSWSSQELLPRCSGSLHQCLGALSDHHCNFCRCVPTAPLDISLLLVPYPWVSKRRYMKRSPVRFIVLNELLSAPWPAPSYVLKLLRTSCVRCGFL